MFLDNLYFPNSLGGPPTKEWREGENRVGWRWNFDSGGKKNPLLLLLGRSATVTNRGEILQQKEEGGRWFRLRAKGEKMSSEEKGAR